MVVGLGVCALLTVVLGRMGGRGGAYVMGAEREDAKGSSTANLAACVR